MKLVSVRPDVPGFDRVFTYAVPESIAEPLAIGTVVRVPLQGRRVRGWIVADTGVAPEGAVREVLEVVSAGPPASVVALAHWTARRYAGNPVSLLRVASPPNRARDVTWGQTTSGSGFAVDVVAIPPTEDRRPLLRATISATGSTLIILPPGTRARALVQALRADGFDAIAYTGSMTDAERTAAWRRACAGNCVVVGGRIAAFAPVPDVAQIIVLDEGDEALAEERTPTWHARDVAIERATQASVPIALVAPAPSLEARVLATHVARPDRQVERDHWPLLEVVDRRDEAHRVGLLTVPFAAAARRALDAGTRVLAVVNRKGRVRLYACGTCHELARCTACQAAVIEGGDGLVCPRCATTRPRVCAACFGTSLKVLRAGVTRLADDLRALLHGVEVVDVDATTEDVPDASVYIGTEALLHRVPRTPHPGLVAFLDFDQELTAPRIRAAEEAQWLLVRAARLVGARARNGRVLVQTAIPDHPVLIAAQHADPLLVADAEAPMREVLGFPPFGGLAAVRGDGGAVTALCDLAAAQDATVIGPTAQGDNLAALIRAASPDELARLLADAAPKARERGRLRIEVDPQRA